MTFTQVYDSPLGDMLLATDEQGLVGLWFMGQKYFADSLASPKECIEHETPALVETKCWLDVYFAGREPDFLPPLHPTGTPFQHAVWDILLQIPYGQITTYGAIARQIATGRGAEHMSAQAVGSAVGRNHISIIIPCHRVVGSNGSLTGYAGGIDKKIRLLELERTDTSKLFAPKHSTAL